MTGIKRLLKFSGNPNLIWFRPEELEKEVISRIQSENRNTGRVSDFIESLFGWVYIGWVRRSLVGAAVILVALFVYQQAFIFRQVKNISKLVVITGSETAQISSSELGKEADALQNVKSVFHREGILKYPGNSWKNFLILITICR